METSQTETRAQVFIEALRALEESVENDATQIATLYANEAVLTNAALDLTGKKIEGRDSILRFWVEYKETLGAVRSIFHHVTASGKAAGLFWTTEGQSPDGEPIRYHGATLLEWNEAGQIVFFRGYYDTRELTVKKEV